MMGIDPDALHWMSCLARVETGETSPVSHVEVDGIPAAYRVAPTRWIAGCLEGEPPPGWPLVRCLRLTPGLVDEASLRQLLRSEVLAGITRLEVGVALDRASMEAIIAHAPGLDTLEILAPAKLDVAAGLPPHLRHVIVHGSRAIDTAFCRALPSGLRRLDVHDVSTATALPREWVPPGLEALGLHGCTFDADAIEALGRALDAEHVRAICVHACSGTAHLDWLRDRCWPMLEELIVIGVPLRRLDSLRQAAPRLRTLDLRHTSVIDTELADALPETVEKLALDRSSLTSTGLSRLASVLGRLQALTIDGATEIAEGLHTVIERHGTELRSLSAEDTDLEDDTLAELAAECPHLETLHIGRTRVSRQGVNALLTSVGAASLRDLDLHGTNLGPPPDRWQGCLPALEILSLANTIFEPSWFVDLFERDRFPCLRALDLCSTRLDEGLTAAVVAQIRATGVQWLNLEGARIDEGELVEMLGAASETVIDMDLSHLQPIDNVGPALARFRWPRLRRLAVVEVIDAGGLREALSSSGLRGLEELVLDYEADGTDEVDALSSARFDALGRLMLMGGGFDWQLFDRLTRINRGSVSPDVIVM